MANKLVQGHIDYLNQGIKATSLNNAFNSAILEGIDVLDITNLDTSLCTNFEDCFHDFKYNVKADNALDMSSATTCNYMFLGSKVRGLHLKNVPRNLDRSYIGGMEDVVYIIDNYLGYNYDGVYGPIPSADKSVSLNNYADKYIQDYENITSVPQENINYLENVKPTSMNRTFFRCTNITSLDLSNIDTSNVTDMTEMLAHCYDLMIINLNNFNTSNVINMKEMFWGCPCPNLDVSSFNTSRVTNMDSMFGGCGFTTINLSNFDTSDVTNMNYMFGGCNNLTTLDLSNFDTSNVTDMNSMFSGCDNLTTIIGAIDMTSVNDCEEMFWGCNKLKDVHLKNVSQSVKNKLERSSSGTEGSTYIIDNYID